MGYSGLGTISDSDNASALLFDIVKYMEKSLKKHVKSRDNEFNTDGYIDVALFIENILLPTAQNFAGHKELVAVAKTAQSLLTQDIAFYKTMKQKGKLDKSANYHIKAYKRLVRSLEKFIDETE